MSPLLFIGIIMAGVPALLIIGFAAYIFLGFVNDDKDAKGVFHVTLAVMGIGLLLILGHVVGTILSA